MVKAKDAATQDNVQDRPPQRLIGLQVVKPRFRRRLLAMFVSEKKSQIITDLDQVHMIS